MEQSFEPASAKRRFVVGAMYHANFTAIPRFIQMLRREAPGVDLQFILHNHATEVVQALDDGRTDLAIGALRDLSKQLRSQQISTDHPVCISRRGHPSLIHGLDLDTFLRLPHASVSQPNHPADEVDVVLAQHHRKRHIKLSISAFYPLVVAIEYSDMIAVVPASVARALSLYIPIDIHEVPLDVSAWPLLMAWTDAGEQDPGIRWLRAFFAKVYAAPWLAVADARF